MEQSEEITALREEVRQLREEIRAHRAMLDGLRAGIAIHHYHHEVPRVGSPAQPTFVPSPPLTPTNPWWWGPTCSASATGGDGVLMNDALGPVPASQGAGSSACESTVHTAMTRPDQAQFPMGASTDFTTFKPECGCQSVSCDGPWTPGEPTCGCTPEQRQTSVYHRDVPGVGRYEVTESFTLVPGSVAVAAPPGVTLTGTFDPLSELITTNPAPHASPPRAPTPFRTFTLRY